MKVKVLLVPLLAVISLALLIWFVYPAFTNGADGLKERYEKKREQKEKIADLDLKDQNVQKLKAHLTSSAEQKNTIFQFLPENMKEEEIIDNLNFLAGGSSLSVVNLSVSQPKPKKEEMIPDIVTMGDTELAEEGAEGSIPINPTPVASDFEVNFSVVGNYENIKDLLGKINSLERFSEAKSLLVAKPKDENVPGDALRADMVLNFNFLKKREVLINLENKAFNLAQFNMKVAEDIKNLKSMDVLKLNIDQAGKANPFIP